MTTFPQDPNAGSSGQYNGTEMPQQSNPGSGTPAGSGGYYGGGPGYDSLQLQAPQPHKRRRGWVLGISLALVLLLIGGGTFGITRLLRTGASAPDQAVEKLLNATEEVNPVELAKLMPPSEFELAQQLQPTYQQASKDFQEDQAKNNKDLEWAGQEVLKSFKVSFTGVTMKTEKLEEDLAKVTLKTGSLTIDADKKALRKALNTMAQAPDSNFSPKDADSAIDQLPKHLPWTQKLADVTAPGDSPAYLMTVKEGGKWYVSPLMSFGEYVYQAVRDHHPSAAPKRGPMPTKTGAKAFGSAKESSKAFTQALFETIKTGNLDSLTGTLSAAEARVWSVYVVPFSGDPIEEDLELLSSEFKSVKHPGKIMGALLTSLDWKYQGETYSFADGCFKNGSQELCLDDSLGALLPNKYSMGSSILKEMIPRLKDQQPQLLSVKEDDGWKVTVSGSAGLLSMQMVGIISSLTRSNAT